MPKSALTLLVSTALLALYATNVQAEEKDKPLIKAKDWTLYASVDLFGYSEPVSIDQFATDFEGSLKSGDTAFTNNIIQTGVKWRNFSIGYVHRFDYITEFTKDTAFIHHSEKNGLAIPDNREYNLLLGVERLEAKGVRFGFTYEFNDTMQIDVAYSYYNDITKLQSGKAAALGDLEPFTEQLKAEAQAVIDALNLDTRDLSPLIPIANQVNADIRIDYAYDEPKFSENEYREPVISGPQNPVISGVSFNEPDGTGYSLDIGFNWQINERLNINVELIDIFNEFSWDNAPQTVATFDLNAFLLDAISVTQDFVNGEEISEQQLIDDHVNVSILNADYDQKLDWRGDFSATYSLDKKLNIYRWTPNISITGGIYHTEMEDFPRIGVVLDQFKLEYDFGGEALVASYQGKYGFVRFISDKLSYEDAYTFGIAAGVQFSF